MNNELQNAIESTSAEELISLFKGWSYPSYALAKVILDSSPYPLVYHLSEAGKYEWSVYEVGDVYIELSTNENDNFVVVYDTIDALCIANDNWLTYDSDSDAFSEINYFLDNIDERTQLAVDHYNNGEATQQDMEYIEQFCITNNMRLSDFIDKVS